MGGKGRRRREKNFVASHGGDKRLPPPPKDKEIWALPSKLRLLMRFKNNPDAKISDKDGSKKQLDDAKIKDKDRKDLNKQKDNKDVNENSDSEEKKKKKKRKVPMDLRFGNMDEVPHTRKKKRKEFLDAKKKKQKKDSNNSNSNKEDEVRNFAGREEIKFGEIVQAPPKLSFPKTKSTMEASKERLRLKAIEEYRNRKNWDSRPGIQLLDPETPAL